MNLWQFFGKGTLHYNEVLWLSHTKCQVVINFRSFQYSDSPVTFEQNNHHEPVTKKKWGFNWYVWVLILSWFLSAQTQRWKAWPLLWCSPSLLLYLMPPSFPDWGMQLMTHHTNNACAPMMPSSNLATAAEAQKARRVDTQVIAAEISVVWAILTFLDAGVHEDTQWVNLQGTGDEG